MANYESTFICTPELPADKIEELIAKIKKVVENTSGKITVTQQLGKKRLAYPINKFREGSYVYMEISGPGNLIGALENFYKVNDPVIRYLTVKVEKKAVKPAAAVVAPEGAKPAAEEGKSHDTVQPSTPGAE